MEIDAFLKKDERPAATWDAKVTAHREATQSHLLTLHGKQIFDPSRFRWPAFLYIPKSADASHYWISPAPDDHR